MATVALRLPAVIQGGMGVAVSNWRLARAVSEAGQLGVVSGTGLDTVLVRRLQDGDLDGAVRRAMEHFPVPGVADAVLGRYFCPGGKLRETPYRLLQMYRQVVSTARQQLTMLANFVEVWLAKERHAGLVGINLLTKLQLPNLPSLYGAMLANVDFVLMGAGIPRDIPGALDHLAEHDTATQRFDVENAAPGVTEQVTFEPRRHTAGEALPALRRPKFLAIIASNSLATMLARKASGRVDGFVVEGPTAGGHNAPPRGPMRLDERGEPVYGERDVVDLAALTELGLPFWVAGGAGSPEALCEAQAAGAQGIQVGTLFAYCDQSGLAPEVRKPILARAARGEVTVRTDPRASPTGYPFKVVEWPDDPIAGQAEPRKRICDLGYLRTPYRDAEGKLGFRCPSEPVDAYVAKGGALEDTVGRRCLCNGLMANIGHAQAREGEPLEPALVTSGDDLVNIGRFLAGREHYSATDVLRYLLRDAMPAEA